MLFVILPHLQWSLRLASVPSVVSLNLSKLFLARMFMAQFLNLHNRTKIRETFFDLGDSLS